MREMYMVWSQLFLKKEDWQRNTFEIIKRNLFSAKDNRFIRYDNSEENHLVMIYGKSQVGKTTLILNMIGIKEEYFHEVYETLRAGVPRGNSSTSTAIIYSKSSNNQYGCSVSSISDLASGNVKYYDKIGMINQLIKIRNDVESNRVDVESVLFIYIPDSFFINDSAVNTISIMDMPGIESRNHKEDIHVQNLMTKYIPISSVCIIACRSNDIQSLEATILPNQMDWKRMDHRFVLVITHSYNDGTTKDYFKMKSSERKQDFYKYVRNTYTQEIRKILGKKNKTEVYPIDVGDTLVKLCTEEIQNESDREEIIATKDKILSDIRHSIVNHKGERLKSALMDLETIANCYGEDEIHSISGKISVCDENIKNRESLIKTAANYIEQLDGEDSEKEEIKLSISSLNSSRQQFINLMSTYMENLSSQAEQYVILNQLYRDSSKGNYLKDKEKILLSYIRTHIYELTERFTDKLIKLIEEVGFDMPINKSNICMQTDDCICAKQDELYPPRNGIFSRRERVYFEDIRSVCDLIQSDVNNTLNSYVWEAIKNIDVSVSEMEEEIRNIDQAAAMQKNKIKKYYAEIDGFKRNIKKLEEQRENIRKKRCQDRETLAMYLKYANEMYLEQRNDIVREINTSNFPDQKLLLILLLGLLDKDYQNVTGGINENSYQYAITK